MSVLASHLIVGGLLDLPIHDLNGVACGMVDDVELSGGPGEPLRIAALLVGPGAYDRRLPRWALALVRLVAGDSMVRVPWGEVSRVEGAVMLKQDAGDYGLGKVDERLCERFPRIPAL